MMNHSVVATAAPVSGRISEVGGQAQSSGAFASLMGSGQEAEASSAAPTAVAATATGGTDDPPADLSDSGEDRVLDNVLAVLDLPLLTAFASKAQGPLPGSAAAPHSPTRATPLRGLQSAVVSAEASAVGLAEVAPSLDLDFAAPTALSSPTPAPAISTPILGGQAVLPPEHAGSLPLTTVPEAAARVALDHATGNLDRVLPATTQAKPSTQGLERGIPFLRAAAAQPDTQALQQIDPDAAESPFSITLPLDAGQRRAADFRAAVKAPLDGVMRRSTTPGIELAVTAAAPAATTVASPQFDAPRIDERTDPLVDSSVLRAAEPDAPANRDAGIFESSPGRSGGAAAKAVLELTLPAQASDRSAIAWADAVATRLEWLAERRIGRAELRLSPAELGTIDITLHVDGKHVRAEFAANSAEVRQALESHLPRLRELMHAQGFSLAHADVGQQSPRQDSLPQQQRDPAPGESRFEAPVDPRQPGKTTAQQQQRAQFLGLSEYA